MQRDNTDPEKKNLLRDRKEERKKRRHSLSKRKSEQKPTVVSSLNECDMKSNSYKMAIEPTVKQTITYINEPYIKEKNEKYAYWGILGRKNRQDDDENTNTSRVSCAFKSIVSSEYTGMFCLFLLFLISVVAVFLIVFKSFPMLDSEGPLLANKGLIADGYRRKIDTFKGKNRIYIPGYKRSVDGDDHIPNNIRELSDFSGSDFDEDGLSESDLEESSKYLSDKFNIGNVDDINDDHLKNFYKKVIETDVQIKSLKKRINREKNNFYKTGRYKRSIRKHNKINKKTKKTTTDKNTADEDDYLNENTEKFKAKDVVDIKITAEPPNDIKSNVTVALNADNKEEINGLVKNTNNNGKFRKCSHLPAETKSHEHEMKHPFYKNSERFDEILDRIINKDLHDVLDEFGVLFKNGKTVCKHKNINKPVDTVTETNKDVSKSLDLQPMKDDLNKKEDDVSNEIRKGMVIPSKKPKVSSDYLLDHVPNIRRLMQAEDTNDDDMQYDEVHEVTRDAVDVRDDTASRKPREIFKHDRKAVRSTVSLSDLNPNWKGPTPLDSDEMNAMMSTAAKANPTEPTEKKAPSIDKAKTEITDLEYMEDYFDGNNDKLTQMAQAYSDYGVLDEKKDTKNDKTPSKGTIGEKGDIMDKRYVTIKGNEPKELREHSEKVDVLKSISDYAKSWKLHSPFSTTNDDSTGPKSVPELNELTKLIKRKEYSLQKSKKNIFGRSLKSIEENLKEDKSIENDKSNVTKVILSPEDDGYNDWTGFQSSTGDLEDVVNIVKSGNETELGPSDLMELMAKWFWAVSNLFSVPNSNITSLNPIVINNPDTNIKSNEANDTVIDENLAHRSRKLLSIKENENKTDNSEKVKVNTVRSTTIIISGVMHDDASTKTSKIKSNLTDGKKNDASSKPNKEKHKMTNKAVFKRNAIYDNNHKSWNEVYDEEYGLDDPVDDQNSNNEKKRDFKDLQDSAKNLLTNSGKWIEGQYKRIATNWKTKTDLDKNERSSRSISESPKESNIVEDKATERKPDQNLGQEVNQKPKHTNFAELTANIETVCKKAAKAIAETRNNAVKKETNEGAMTNNLMQQLVRLMTDVVEMKVQEKTCLKLPPDLAEFLQWLTQPDPDEREKKSNFNTVLEMDSKLNDFEYLNSDANTNLDMTTPSSDEEASPIADYFSTLQAVQDLIQQYNNMNDGDKQKMSGLHGYLVKQEEFLNSMVTLSEDMGITSVRKKKETQLKGENRSNESFKLRPKRKFQRINGKKHTQPILTTCDSANSLTEEPRSKDEEEDKRSKEDRRNIYDVYYRAVEESKKMTTAVTKKIFVRVSNGK